MWIDTLGGVADRWWGSHLQYQDTIEGMDMESHVALYIFKYLLFRCEGMRAKKLRLGRLNIALQTLPQQGRSACYQWQLNRGEGEFYPRSFHGILHTEFFKVNSLALDNVTLRAYSVRLLHSENNGIIGRGKGSWITRMAGLYSFTVVERILSTISFEKKKRSIQATEIQVKAQSQY